MNKRLLSTMQYTPIYLTIPDHIECIAMCINLDILLMWHFLITTPHGVVWDNTYMGWAHSTD